MRPTHRYTTSVALLFAVIRALLVASALTALIMVDIGVPDEDYWSDKDYIIYVALGMAFLSYVPGGLAQWYLRRNQAESAYKYHKNIQASLSAALVEVTENTKSSWREVGVHAFWIRKSVLGRRLVNIGGVRLGATPSMDRPAWKRGKGVIGRAWSIEDKATANWREFHEINRALGKEEWNKKEHEFRFGMSWNELTQSSDYDAIVAYPIVNLSTNEIVGCVSIDGPLSREEYDGDKVGTVIQQLAQAVLKAGEPPHYWFQQRV